MKRFIAVLLISSLFLYGVTVLLHRESFFQVFPTFFWQTLIFLNFATIMIFYYLTKSGEGAFVQLYLLTMVLKLLAYSGYNVLIILRDRENAGINVGFFMITYLIFTTLELIFLYRKISR